MSNINTTTSNIITCDERGDFVTKKSTKAQIRAFAQDRGFNLGLFTKAKTEAGDLFTAAVRDNDLMTFGALRVVGAVIEVKGGATSPVLAEGSDRIEIAKGKPQSVEDCRRMSWDALGEFLNLSPKKGGLTAAAIRTMLEAEGIEVAKRMKKTDLQDLLAQAVVREVTAPETDGVVILDPATGKQVTFESIAAELGFPTI